MQFLASYFDRIGFQADATPDLGTLNALHLLHPGAIPFENLSTLVGDPVRLEIEQLQEKLIYQRRGGYCFEQNTLFQAVLEAIGFEVVPLAARVVWNSKRAPGNPRTHMVLLVHISGDRFLCDVGFGGATLTAPLAFEPGTVQQTPHEPFRLRQSGSEFSLEVKLGPDWRAAYEFDLQPQRPIDYEAMNHFVQTHPSSHFRHILMAGRTDEQGRYALGGNELSRYERGILVDRQRLRSAEALAGALTGQFRITLPTAASLGSILERTAATDDE